MLASIMRTRPSETFILRIYRRSKQRPDMIVGTVEDAALQSEVPFHNLKEPGTFLAEDPQYAAGKPTRHEEKGVREGSSLSLRE